MSRRNRRIDNFPPNYSSFGPLQSYLLHARGWKPILESAATLKTWTLVFSLQFTPTHTYYRYFLFFHAFFHHLSLKYLFLLLFSQLLPSRLFHLPRKIRWKKNTVFPFFYNSMHTCKFDCHSSFSISFIYPKISFHFPSHVSIYIISRNLFLKKILTKLE